MNKIRKGDQVVVLIGKDKGKRGSVLGFPSAGKVLVSGVNIAKRHTKPNPMAGVPGGILDKEMPLDFSNVALFNPGTGKGSKVGFKFLEDGTKVRYFKSTGEVVGS